MAVMCGCVAGKAYVGSLPKAEAEKEGERIKALLKFGDGKIHTAAHAITKRLYAAFPELGRNIRQFPKLLNVSPLRLPADTLKRTSLFGYLTTLFDDSDLSTRECAELLEKAGL